MKKNMIGNYTGSNLITHGLSHLPEYRIYASMIQRCFNSKSKFFKNYGGRGIVVCAEWRNNFEKFYRDMGPRPSIKHSIDRINNNGNYEPNNCKWVTRDIQNRNTRLNRIITFKNKTMYCCDWAKYLGITQSTLHTRLERWSLERALTEKPRAYFHNTKR